MERRTSTYGPSWGEVNEWLRGLEEDFNVAAVFTISTADRRLHGNHLIVRLRVLGSVSAAPEAPIYEDFRLYPQKSYRSFPEALHALILGAYSTLDRGRDRAKGRT